MTKDHPLVQRTLETTKRLLKENDDLLPTFFVGNEKETNVIGTPFGLDPSDKDRAAQAVKAMVAKIGAEYVLFISEAWTLPQDNQDAVKDFMENRDKYPSVSSHPAAIEAVMISLETKDQVWMGRAPILPKREMGEVQWIDVTEGESTGRFTNFLGNKPKTPSVNKDVVFH